LGLNLCVGDTSKVALTEEQRLLVRSVDIGAINRTCEVGDEHAASPAIEREADASIKYVKRIVGSLRTPGETGSMGARFTVLPRGGHPGLSSKSSGCVNRVRGQWAPANLVEQFNVLAVRGCLARRNVCIGTKDTAFARIVRAF